MTKSFGKLALRYDLDQNLDLLCTSDGYKKTDKYRQKLMRVALKIQHRLDHHLVLGSAKQNYKLVPTHRFLVSTNCHESAFCVEHQLSYRYRPKPPPSKFFRSSFYGILPYSIHIQARFAILRKTFPSIVQISNDGEGIDVLHSFIALDETKDGKDIIIWEKQGIVYPFRVTTLSEVFNYYTFPGHECYWAVRPLQTPR